MESKKVVHELITRFGWSEEAAKLGIRSNFRCEYCGCNLLESVDNYKSWQKDHIIPISRGGDEKDFDNIALSCRTCNFNLKGDWDPSTDVKTNASRDELINSIKRKIEKQRDKVLSEILEIRKLIHQAS